MPNSYCQSCGKPKHYRNFRGSKLSDLSCDDCGGKLGRNKPISREQIEEANELCIAQTMIDLATKDEMEKARRRDRARAKNI